VTRLAHAGVRMMRYASAGAMAVVASLAVSGFLSSARADSSDTPPRLPGKVGLSQKLNAQVPLDLMFRDENGRVIHLRELFRGKPVLLTFMYYRCPMLCSVVQEGVASTLTELKLDVGKDFDVITVSFDPRDTPAQATAKKEHFIRRYGRFEAASGWHFLTSNESAIKRLTNAVGFEYAYDPKVDQFAHTAAIMVLTPQGRVSRYFPGFEYKPRDIRLGLVEASQNKIGTISDTILLLCYHYDPATGKYSKSAMNFVRAGGVATVMGLASFIFVMVRGERQREKNALHVVGNTENKEIMNPRDPAADTKDETNTR
jgi:protein SCO1/2